QFRARPPRRRPRSRIPLHPSAEEPALRTLQLAPTLASAPDSPGWSRRKRQEGGKKKGGRRRVSEGVGVGGRRDRHCCWRIGVVSVLLALGRRWTFSVEKSRCRGRLN